MDTKLRLPLGQSDFRVLREQGYAYVDKTAFVTEVLDANDPARHGLTGSLCEGAPRALAAPGASPR